MTPHSYWEALALLQEEYSRAATEAEDRYERLKNQAHRQYKKVYDAELRRYKEIASQADADADTVRTAFETYRNVSEQAWKVYARVAFGEPLATYEQAQKRALDQLIIAAALLDEQFFATSAPVSDASKGAGQN